MTDLSKLTGLLTEWEVSHSVTETDSARVVRIPAEVSTYSNPFIKYPNVGGYTGFYGEATFSLDGKFQHIDFWE